MAVSTHTLFREAMTHLASGVAVITARRPEGAPCGIAATSLTSYSAYPPSPARVGVARVPLPRRPRRQRALRGAPADERRARPRSALRQPRARGQVPRARLALGRRRAGAGRDARLPPLRPRGELRQVRPHHPDRRPRGRPPGGGRAARLRAPADGLAHAADAVITRSQPSAARRTMAGRSRSP